MTATTTGEMDQSFAQRAVGISGFIEHLTRGERAELRRMRDGTLFPPEPFWRIVGRYDIPPSEETFWIDMIPLMVRHPHNPSLPPGLALAQSGVSPARIERWLRLEPERARKEAVRLLARLDQGLNWAKFAGLLRFWGDSDRRRFARDYFLSPEHRERKLKLQSKETSR